MDFNKDRTRVELEYNEVKKLPWFGQLVSDLRGTDMQEIEKEKPSFRFFKNGEAEMFVGQSQAESSDGFVSIGAVGVEGKEWDSFLQELDEYVLETNLDSSIPLREKLDKISHKQDMRRSAKEINDTGIGGVAEIVNPTVAHWAEQILQEHYGNSNYGFTVKASRQGNKVLLENNEAHGRTEPTEIRGAMELKRDYTGAVGFAEEGEIKRMKDVAVEWFETEAVRVADEALDKIRRIEEQQMMR